MRPGGRGKAAGPRGRQRAGARVRPAGASRPAGRGVEAQCSETSRAWWEAHAGGHRHPLSRQGERGSARPVTRQHQDPHGSRVAERGPLHCHLRQLVGLRARPQPRALRGREEVIPTGLSMFSGTREVVRTLCSVDHFLSEEPMPRALDTNGDTTAKRDGNREGGAPGTRTPSQAPGRALSRQAAANRPTAWFHPAYRLRKVFTFSNGWGEREQYFVTCGKYMQFTCHSSRIRVGAQPLARSQIISAAQ